MPQRLICHLNVFWKVHYNFIDLSILGLHPVESYLNSDYSIWVFHDKQFLQVCQIWQIYLSLKMDYFLKTYPQTIENLKTSGVVFHY